MKIPEQFLSELKSAGLLRSLRNVECLPGGMARMEDGREVVNLASNDYLGLAHHPALVEAFARGARDGGAGAMASRLVTGTRRVHSRTGGGPGGAEGNGGRREFFLRLCHVRGGDRLHCGRE